jgi:hypothetical protein
MLLLSHSAITCWHTLADSVQNLGLRMLADGRHGGAAAADSVGSIGGFRRVR